MDNKDQEVNKEEWEVHHQELMEEASILVHLQTPQDHHHHQLSKVKQNSDQNYSEKNKI
jgi:hypothetical protein